MKHSASNKILSGLLVLVMAVCLMSTSVLTAFAVTEYSLWVGGVRVTSANCDDILGDGTACYYPANNLLELYDFTYTGSGYANSGIYYNGTGENLIIHAYGECVITADTSKSTDLSGITVENTGLELRGGITFATGDEMDCFGIWVSGDLYINGAEVHAEAGNASSSTNGVYVSEGDLIIDNDGVLYASTGHAMRNYNSLGDSYGVYVASGSVEVYSGVLYANAGKADYSYGIYAYENLNIYDSEIKAVGCDDAYTASYGIYLEEGCAYISVCVVDAHGGSAANGSFGMYVGDVLYAESGTLYASSDSADYTYGIYVYNGIDMDSDDTFIDATAGDAVYESYGVYCYDNITISDGTLYADGGKSSEGIGFGLFVYFDMYSYGGTVYATANRCYEYSYGLYVGETLVVDGGDVYAYGGYSETDSSIGTFVSEGIEVKSGVLYGSSHNGINTYGVYNIEGDINVSGGTLFGKAYDAGDDCTGIQSKTNINISGGKVEAIACSAEDGNSRALTSNEKLNMTGGAIAASSGTSHNGESTALCAYAFNITDGSIMAQAGTAATWSVGILAELEFNLSGGNIVAVAGEAADAESIGVYLYSDSAISGGDIAAFGYAQAYNADPTIIASTAWSPVVYQGNDANTSTEVSVDKLDVTKMYVRVKGDKSAILLGDVDGDGDIDQFDYLLVKRAYFGTYALDEDAQARADVDRSGEVDQMDYLCIKRAYFGTYVIG